jgi:predicted nuclease of predicted toxin-antitoxin system
LRFLVDAQLPPALARRIAALGHEAQHVADCGLAAAPDDAIWKHASEWPAIVRALAQGETLVEVA